MDKDCIFVTECWCKVWNGHKESLVYHSNSKSSVLEAVTRFIKQTNDVVATGGGVKIWVE